MKNYGQHFGEIAREKKGLFSLMAFLALVCLVLFIISVVTLKPSTAVVKVGYGDIGSFAGEDLVEMRTAGGYRDGSWVDMLAFPILAVVLGVIHNFISIRICVKRGDSAAKAFVLISIGVALGAILVLFRLLGEG